MRKYINNDWNFKNDFKDDYLKSFTKINSDSIRIPHSVKNIPYNYVNNNNYQMISTYFKHVDLKEYKNKKIFLCFEGVAHKSEVYLNSKLAKVHECGYTGFKILLNEFLDENNQVDILVKVNSFENLNQPPFGNVIDYLTYGGIYRDVYLDIKNDVYFEDIFIKASMDKTLKIETKVNKIDDLKLHIKIANIDNIYDYNSLIEIKNLDVELWDVENPNLYELTLELIKCNDVIDTFKYNVGFRSISKDENNILLNNKIIKIRGLNRHQAYPYVGYAMPKRGQIFDAHVLKYELGLNAVRTSHYPQNQDFLNECDKIGLLVFTEIPGWQYIGDEAWKNKAIKNTKDMILESRNHPSIFMWGVRINESKDDHDFYIQTNKIARDLDDTRLIGGVRCFRGSELLEDIYTFNDFIHTGNNIGVLKKRKVTKNKNPLLVTEYNGHMYPTKMFDDEIHRTNHLKRHLKVLNDVMEDKKHAGCFGWCFADYNTHKDFGSGDEICYHGVLDMFRNPKLASYVYSTQQDETPILKINSTMDIGEYPGGYMDDLIVLTNLDKIILYKGEEEVKTFYPSKEYKGLKHPPIIIDDLVGNLIEKHENYKVNDAKILKNCLLDIKKTGLEHMSFKTLIKMAYLLIFRGFTIADGENLYGKYIGGWGDSNTSFKIVGYKNNKQIKQIKIESFKELKFKILVDETNLVEDKSYDVASIRIEALNQVNNHLSYFNEPIRFETEGAISLIGPEIISLKGGFGGCYIKSKEVGIGKLRIYHNNNLIKEIEFNVRKDDINF